MHSNQTSSTQTSTSHGKDEINVFIGNLSKPSDSYKESIIKQVKQVYNDELKSTIIKFKEANISTQAAAGQRLSVEADVLRKALDIFGDTVYDLDLENEALKEKLKEYGELDIEKLKQLIEYKKSNTELEDKNKRILSRLSLTMDKSKMIQKK